MDNSERMERVNALATQAKSDKSVIPALWEMVEQLVRVVCRRYCRPNMSTRLYEYDDLCQSAYLAFLKAIDTYDHERGAFSSLLIYRVRGSCSAVIGRYGKRDALFDANSLNSSTYHDDESATTLSDSIIDPDAEQALEGVVDQVYTKQLRAALDECMEKIPQYQADALRARYYHNATFSSIGARRSVSAESARRDVDKALASMRQREVVGPLLAFWEKEIIDESLRYSGFKFFKNHGYSSVEWAAEQLLQRSKRREAILRD